MSYKLEMAEPGPADFEVWVKENGGDDDLLKELRDNGFTSKLSIKHLDLESSEATNFLSSLNYGQKCL